MHGLTSDLSRLSSAEEFFAYFGLDYDPRVLNVSRLHILKRFSQYLEAGSRWRELPEADARAVCRELLNRAYREFEGSSGVEQGLFKVFDQARGVQKVPVSKIRRASAAREGSS